MNVESRDMLVRLTQTLVAEREFPGPTLLNMATTLQWLFVGDAGGTKFDHRRLRWGSLEKIFMLNVLDVNGAAFADDTLQVNAHPDIVARAMGHLASAAGIIYLFDPISERQNGNSANYFNGVLVELQRRYAALGQWRRYLPQHVAVCVTKFDHPEVFQQARRLGFVNTGPDGIPRVLDKDAEAFFDALCSGDFWGERDGPHQASARFVQHQLQSAFDPRHIRYYVTSSIGFWRPPGWVASSLPNPAAFDPNDFANYYEKESGNAGIRGAISPVNVLEPLVGLMGQIENR